MSDQEQQFEIEGDEPEVTQQQSAEGQQPDLEKEIEVVDDTPESDRNRKKGPPVEVNDDEIAQYSDNVQKRIKDLRRAYHDERREKERAFREQQEAIRFAKTIADQNRELQERLKTGEQVLVEAQKTGVDAKLLSAEKEFKEAHESGDVEKMLDAQKKLAMFSVEKREVDNYRPKYQEPLQRPNVDVETMPQVVPDERTRRWVESNKWFDTDPVMRGAALGIHDELVSKGYQAGSEAYFEQVDARIRESFPQKFGQARPPSNVVAPAARTEPSSGKIKLTKTQVAMAKRLGVPLERYVASIRKGEQNV
jgi:hypothetical protein